MRASPRVAVGLAAAGLATLAIVVARNAMVPDDSSIVWRYVMNLRAGDGLVYNRGEAVNACTSPLQMLLLAGVGGCGVERLAAFRWLGALAIAGAAVFALLGCRRASGGCAAPFAVAATVVLLPLFASTGGLETSLQAALLLATWCAAQRRRWPLFGVSAGLAMLARLDTVLFALACVGAAARDRRPHWRRDVPGMLLGAAIVLLPWCVFSWCAYGGVLPATLSAKMAQGASGWWPTDRFLRSLQTSLAAFDTWRLGVGYKPYFALLLAGGAAAIAAPRWRPFAIYAAVHAAAYALLCVPFYHWYALPTHLALAVAPYAIGECAWLPVRVRSWIGGAAALLLLASTSGLRAPALAPEPYADAGEWIAANSPSTAVVAAAEVGGLGIAVWPRPVLDLAGIVSPQARPHLRARDFAWPLRGPLPAFFVLHEPVWPGLESAITTDAAFAAAYARVPEAFTHQVVVWRRR